MSGLPSPADGGSDSEDGNPRSFPLLFQQLAAGPVRDAAVTQLASSSRDEAVVRAWCEAGDVCALVDVGAGDETPPPAAAVVVPRGGGTMELALLVTPGSQGSDLARRMLAQLCDALRRREVRRLTAAATNVEIPLMAALQDAGFRFESVERDGCTAEHGLSPVVVDGVPARDLVWFDQSL
ncbi:MAG: hypothetical protein QOJ69_338 [Actinomycetota bacterium]|nr:hypothetical protein [Actinomycetota bacterium]